MVIMAINKIQFTTVYSKTLNQKKKVPTAFTQMTGRPQKSGCPFLTNSY